ncbi:ubiquinone anaerobic biosynthesis protein UbiV [Denitrobaculum tricleocarpae]|uniref:Ubiquinone biosynthesis protein UbiV n=1 Tax=Denitrobaculum tricleocarpae TaxID=2591009 RepID=A0A545TRF0_9PROT|nr:U32 family peptidase [Denitrobaculum tricleocarpae]TQV79807.1 U32 family peptidase [Denitrobaculum tricleocarpae]
MTTLLTLGPLLYHWPAEAWRDFYFRIADEAPVASVCMGEVVCPKRAPFTFPLYEEVIERLQAAGKEVVLSTPALITDHRDLALVKDAVELGAGLVEANDVAALPLLTGKPHVIGPYINVYNESTLARMAADGAVRVTLPAELPAASIGKLAEQDSAAIGMPEIGMPMIEIQVFGRWPLAISARCYHARAYERSKDGCLYACGEDPDGLPVETLDDEPFLVVNGVQTQSASYGCLLNELDLLKACGVRRFRLSPQTIGMIEVARLFRDRLDGRIDREEASVALRQLAGHTALSNGFFHGREGAQFV